MRRMIRRRRTDGGGVSRWERFGLGHWPRVGPGWFRGEVDVAELWETHRDQVLRDWVFGYEDDPSHGWQAGRPGTRPGAWWVFDVVEPRREGESQLDYLARHGLLLPGEAEAVEALPPERPYIILPNGTARPARDDELDGQWNGEW
jgi:hypothetical protein